MIDTARIYIDVLGCLEAQCVILAARNALVVHQILDADVIGGNVATTCSAPETQSRGQIVVHATKSTDRGRTIDNHPTGINRQRELFDPIFIQTEDSGGVTGST